MQILNIGGIMWCTFNNKGGEKFCQVFTAKKFTKTLGVISKYLFSLRRVKLTLCALTWLVLQFANCYTYYMSDKNIAHLPGCRCGKHRQTLEKDDPWYVNAPEYYNCFFTYIRLNDRKHTYNEIAQKLNLSISSIISTQKRALKKLQRKLSK